MLIYNELSQLINMLNKEIKCGANIALCQLHDEKIWPFEIGKTKIPATKPNFAISNYLILPCL